MPARPDPALTARVLDAARILSDERGDAWSMVELARAAGIARASLQRRFRRREDVLDALARAAAGAGGQEAPTIRDRALDAFAAVARRKGLAGTTLEDVATEAGLGVATIYRHFGGREGLLDAYADERTPRAALVGLGPDPRQPLADVLRTLARAMIEHLVAHGPLVLLGLSPDPEARRMLGHLRDLEARSRAELRAYFERWIERGQLRGDAATLTNGFVGMVAGSVLLDASASIEAEQLAGRVVSLFLHGCGASAPAEDGARSRARRSAARKAGAR